MLLDLVRRNGQTSSSQALVIPPPLGGLGAVCLIVSRNSPFMTQLHPYDQSRVLAGFSRVFKSARRAGELGRCECEGRHQEGREP